MNKPPEDISVETRALLEALARLRKCECPDHGARCQNCRDYCELLDFIKALSPSPTVAETAGRTEISMDHPLAKTMRPSKECIKEIERAEQARAEGFARLRNTPLGSTVAETEARISAGLRAEAGPTNNIRDAIRRNIADAIERGEYRGEG